MTSPIPSSRSASPQPSTSRHSDVVMTSPLADPFAHLASFINSLQSKAKSDSDQINKLKNDLENLRKVQSEQQDQIDAIQAVHVKLSKAVEPSSSQGSGGSVGGTRKRARSVTDTLEQEQDDVDNTAVDKTSTTIIAKLATLEVTLLNEVRQSAAAMAGTGEADCDCGVVADEAADRLVTKIDNLEATLKKLIEDKMVQLEGALADKLHAVESNVVGTVEEYSGGCECGDVFEVQDTLERKIDDVTQQVGHDVRSVSDIVDKVADKITAQLDRINKLNSDLVAKLDSRTGHVLCAPPPDMPTPPQRTYHADPPVFFSMIAGSPGSSLNGDAPLGARNALAPGRPSAQASTSAAVNGLDYDSSIAKAMASSSQGAKEPARKKAKNHAVRFAKLNDELAKSLFPAEETSSNSDES